MQIAKTPMSAYISEAYQFDFLSRNEERELLEAFKINGDMQAREKLVHANLGNVIKIARELSGYNVDFDDLVQAGNIGLLKALDKFSLEYDVRLYTFAMHQIKSEMYDFVIKNFSIMNIAPSKALRKAFFSLRKYRNHFGTLKEHEVVDIANRLNIKPKHVKMMEERFMHNAFVPFDMPTGNYGSLNDDLFAPKDFVESDEVEPEELMIFDETKSHLNNTMYESLKSLDDRSKDIIQRRWLSSEKSTLHDLADKYKVSAERIRQIEKNALEKMRTRMVN